MLGADIDGQTPLGISASQVAVPFLFSLDDDYMIELHKKAVHDGLDFTSEMLFENGSMYKGYLLKGQRHGPGVQVWPDDARYEGEWRNNRANGRGKFWHADGDVYEGEWLDDKTSGYGVYVNAKGGKIEGYWKDDLQEGHCVETLPDGSKYEGDFVKGKK